MPSADCFDAGNTFALVAAGLHTTTACLMAAEAPVYQLQMDLEEESCHHHNSSSHSRKASACQQEKLSIASSLHIATAPGCQK